MPFFLVINESYRYIICGANNTQRALHATPKVSPKNRFGKMYWVATADMLPRSLRFFNHSGGRKSNVPFKMKKAFHALP